jgi:dUTPase
MRNDDGDKMNDIPKFMFALREDLKNDKHFLPSRAEPYATGWDVSCATKDHKDLVVRPGAYVKIDLGFRVFCPDGWWLKLEPRSSTFTKKSLHSLCGVIDSSYEGSMAYCGFYSPDVNAMGKDLVIKFGERIGQIIPVLRQEMIVDEISNGDYDKFCEKRNGVRKTGGFGSSDLK